MDQIRWQDRERRHGREPTRRGALKVLHVIKATGVSGAERHLLALLPGLQARGVDVSICVLVAGDGESFVERLRAARVPTTTLPAGPDANPLLVARLRREIRRTGPDLVHTHLVHADVHGLVAARLARVPAVSSMHDRPPFYRSQPYRTAGRLTGLLAARRIAISQAVADFIDEMGLSRRSRVTVVPYGIEVGEWVVADGAREVARQQLGIRGDDVAVGIASRLIPHKGHDVLLEAIGLVADRAPGVRLLVAGAGPIRDELEAHAARVAPGRVRFLGYVTDIRSFIHACDVIAFPADPEIGEGFGLAALEAMAAGRPVLATPTGALHELVVHGETGLLVAPKSGAELADALARLASDPVERERMGARAADRAAKSYGFDAMVYATVDVYRSVTGA